MTKTPKKRNLDLTVAALESKKSKETNEDYGEIAWNNCLCAIAIADGVGSSPDSHLAAKTAARSFLTSVKAACNRELEISDRLVEGFWRRASEQINIVFKERAALYGNSGKALETTLVTLIELKDSYFVSYLGNGSLWYIRGDFWEFGQHRWPWAMCDLMVTHTVLEEGKESLYGILSPKGVHGNVRFLKISKDSVFGELLVITSDGVSSPDHNRVGQDDNGKLWVEVNPHLERLLREQLQQYLKIQRSSHDTRAVELQCVLKDFLAQGDFDDDATIAVMVSSPVFRHYLDQQTKKKG